MTNITKEELKKISLELGRGERIEKDLFKFLNDIPEEDFKVCIKALRKIYGWDGPNHRIMHKSMLQAEIHVHYREDISEDTCKKLYS